MQPGSHDLKDHLINLPVPPTPELRISPTGATGPRQSHWLADQPRRQVKERRQSRQVPPEGDRSQADPAKKRSWPAALVANPEQPKETAEPPEPIHREIMKLCMDFYQRNMPRLAFPDIRATKPMDQPQTLIWFRDLDHCSGSIGLSPNSWYGDPAASLKPVWAS